MKHSDLIKKEDENKNIKNEMNKYGLTAKAINGKFYSYRNGKLTGTFNNIKDLQKHQAELIKDESVHEKEFNPSDRDEPGQEHDQAPREGDVVNHKDLGKVSVVKVTGSDQMGQPAEYMVQAKLSYDELMGDVELGKFESIDQDTDESGIMYRAGVKKYGKDGMKKIQSAAGKGASAEEIGKIKDQHNKKKKESVQEDLALMAQKAEMDHEVQMARSDLYKAAKYSIKLHDMLKSVSEQQGLEGWVAAKITKASDYLSSVYHYMEYELMSETVTYLDEGWLDTIKAAGRAITPDSVKALFDPATAAKVQADDQANVQMQTLFRDINTVTGMNQTDVSQGYPTDLVAAYLRKFVQPKHPEAFQRMDAQGDIKKMFPPKGKVDANTLKANLTKVAQELGKVDLSPEPQAKPQPQAQPQTASIDYKESLTNKLQSKLKESKKTCKDCGKPTWETLDEAEKQKGVDGKVCWKGYKRMGTKMKGGKRVDNCVPIKKK